MRKFIFVFLMLLSAYSLACAGVVEVNARVEEPIAISTIGSHPLSLTVLDCNKINPTYKACKIFGFASVWQDNEVLFTNKLLLCTDGKQSCSKQITGEARFNGEFVINGDKAQYDELKDNISFQKYLLCGNTCGDKQTEQIEWKLRILKPAAVISPYETFTFTIESIAE